MKEAIMPDFFKPAFKEVTKIISKPQPGDEEQMIGFAQSDLWKTIKGKIEGKKELLRDMTIKASRKANTLEEFGLRYAMLDQVCAAYDSIIDMVELPLKAQNAKSTRKRK